MITNAPTERWRPVPGFVGWDEVSSHGRVRGVDRLIIRRNGSPYTAAAVFERPRSTRAPAWPTCLFGGAVGNHCGLQDQATLSTACVC
jgi:NUMOD4 motif